jgi:hypothetical protein
VTGCDHIWYGGPIRSLENINTIKKNTEVPFGASKGVDLEVNAKETKCMVVSYRQNAGQYHKVKITYKSVENVAKFLCFRTTVTNQNYTDEGNKSRLHFWDACCRSVRNVLSSRPLSHAYNFTRCVYGRCTL